MAQFFLTTSMKNKDVTFQLHWETSEANSIEQLCDLLEQGKIVIGERFHRRDPSTGRSKVAIALPMIAMIQMSTPVPERVAA